MSKDSRISLAPGFVVSLRMRGRNMHASIARSAKQCKLCQLYHSTIKLRHCCLVCSLSSNASKNPTAGKNIIWCFKKRSLLSPFTESRRNQYLAVSTLLRMQSTKCSTPRQTLQKKVSKALQTNEFSQMLYMGISIF